MTGKTLSAAMDVYQFLRSIPEDKCAVVIKDPSGCLLIRFEDMPPIHKDSPFTSFDEDGRPPEFQEPYSSDWFYERYSRK